MMRKNLTYQCFFVDKRNYLREGFIAASAGLLGFEESGARKETVQLGNPAKVILEGVPKGSSDEALGAAVKRAAEAATNFSWLSKGDTVLIKPANNSGEPYPATTSPVGLKAMIELLKAKGAGKVIVMDMAGIEHVKLMPEGLCGSTRGLMRKNGILAAVESAGGEVYLPEEEGWEAFFEDFPTAGSHWKNGIWVPKKLKEVQHIVLMPRVSRHPLAGATLGLKAAVGYLRFDSRLEYHRDARTYYEKHVEINTVPSIRDKLRLVLTTATKVQATFGPDNGYVSEPDMGLLIASPSIVAHDMVSLAWLLQNRETTPEKRKHGAHDPYATNSAVISSLNRGVVFLLGGAREAMKTEKLQKYDLSAIPCDPTLHRAFELWGGMPKVELDDQTGKVPLEVRKRLAERMVF